MGPEAVDDAVEAEFEVVTSQWTPSSSRRGTSLREAGDVQQLSPASEVLGQSGFPPAPPSSERQRRSTAHVESPPPPASAASTASPTSAASTASVASSPVEAFEAPGPRRRGSRRSVAWDFKDVAVSGFQPGASSSSVSSRKEAEHTALDVAGGNAPPTAVQSQEILAPDVPGQIQAQPLANGHAEQQAEEVAARRSRVEAARKSQLEAAQKARDEAEERARQEAEKAKKDSSAGWFGNWWGSAPSTSKAPSTSQAEASPSRQFAPRMSLEQWLNEPAPSQANGK